MEWFELFNNQNLADFLADYSLAIGFVLAVAKVVASMTSSKKDDKIIAALEEKFSLIPKK